MRRAMVMVLSLLAACTSEAPNGNGGTEPAEEPVPAVEGVKFREGPGGVEVPPVKFKNPGAEGQPTQVDARVIAAQTGPLGERSPRPLALLARSPQEANLIFAKLPAGAKELVRTYTEWERRSLILFTGGAQPDASFRVELEGIGVIQGGTTIQMFGRFKEEKGAAAEVISEPWVLASVNVAFTVKAEKCLLVFPEISAFETNCH